MGNLNTEANFFTADITLSHNLHLLDFDYIAQIIITDKKQKSKCFFKNFFILLKMLLYKEVCGKILYMYFEGYSLKWYIKLITEIYI